MSQGERLTDGRLTTPRAAAIAGILFAVLLIISMVLIRISIPADPKEAGALLEQEARRVSLALNLVPFAGIAFLWFIGVLRDRIGDHEDRFFATVFLGSGLLFLAMLFASAAIAGGLLVSYGSIPPLERSTYAFGRAMTYEVVNVYAMKMAGVFMISTATISVRTAIMPRWMSLLTYVVALVQLLSIGFVVWAILLFPLWVLLISVYILVMNLGGRSPAVAKRPV
jgi:MFS family permease